MQAVLDRPLAEKVLQGKIQVGRIHQIWEAKIQGGLKDPPDPGGKDPQDPGGKGVGGIDPGYPGGQDPPDPGGKDPSDLGGQAPGGIYPGW